MQQPAAHYRDDDLSRVIKRDFPTGVRAEVSAVLDLYGQENWHSDSLRVRMACLKLAAGNLVELKKFVQVACLDYRDVLAWAEYPAYLRARSQEEQEPAIKADWTELQKWLHRE